MADAACKTQPNEYEFVPSDRRIAVKNAFSYLFNVPGAAVSEAFVDSFMQKMSGEWIGVGRSSLRRLIDGELTDGVKPLPDLRQNVVVQTVLWLLDAADALEIDALDPECLFPSHYPENAIEVSGVSPGEIIPAGTRIQLTQVVGTDQYAPIFADNGQKISECVQNIQTGEVMTMAEFEERYGKTYWKKAQEQENREENIAKNTEFPDKFSVSAQEHCGTTVSDILSRQENPHAEEVRSDAGQVQEGRERREADVGQGGEGQGGENLQREAQAGPEAGHSEGLADPAKHRRKRRRHRNTRFTT